MLFNSFEFVIFFGIVLILYWTLCRKHIKWQNALVLLSSYIFYGWWDWRFLCLIALSTIVDYFVGLQLHSTQEISKRRFYFWISILFNIGLLAFFKYCGFFVDSFIGALQLIGYSVDPWTLNIILPVGISFYTFQSMSYSIDIYNHKLKPTRDIVAFAAFVSFFPQLVAGPIERAKSLLPQFLRQRSVTKRDLIVASQLLVLGFFKKMVIADSLAPLVNSIFDNYNSVTGLTLVLGALYFGIQIYADFSGYSNIARGLARFMGFRLMTNFDYPYFSRNIGEFWRRWHISLSSWFRDYVYIPLGGSRGSKILSIRNIVIVFLISGLWHGANWTFVIWGLYHALLFVPLFLLGRNRSFLDSMFQSRVNINSVFQVFFTFFLVTFGWVFFRAESIGQAFSYLHNVFTKSWISMDYSFGLVLVFTLIIVDLILARQKDRPSFYYVLLGGIIAGVLVSSPAEFIYFQF